MSKTFTPITLTPDQVTAVMSVLTFHPTSNMYYLKPSKLTTFEDPNGTYKFLTIFQAGVKGKIGTFYYCHDSKYPNPNTGLKLADPMISPTFFNTEEVCKLMKDW